MLLQVCKQCRSRASNTYRILVSVIPHSEYRLTFSDIFFMAVVNGYNVELRAVYLTHYSTSIAGCGAGDIYSSL